MHIVLPGKLIEYETMVKLEHKIAKSFYALRAFENLTPRTSIYPNLSRNHVSSNSGKTAHPLALSNKNSPFTCATQSVKRFTVNGASKRVIQLTHVSLNFNNPFIAHDLQFYGSG